MRREMKKREAARSEIYFLRENKENNLLPKEGQSISSNKVWNELIISTRYEIQRSQPGNPNAYVAPAVVIEGKT